MLSDYKLKIANVNTNRKIVPIKAILDNPNLINDLPPADKAVINFILLLSSKFNIVRPSQETIAKNCNIGERQVRKSIANLKKLGLLDTIYRGFTSLVYIVSSWFLDHNVTRKLTNVFPLFMAICLIYIFTISTNTYTYEKLNTSQVEIGRQCIKNSLSFPSLSFFPSNSITKAGRRNGITKKDSLENQRQYEQNPSGISTHASAREKNLTTLKKDSMNFEALTSTMNLSSADAKLMTVFTLSLLEKMHDKLPAYGNFKEFFEACISESNIMRQPINWKLLGEIRATQPKKSYTTQKASTSAPKPVEAKPWLPNGINVWQHKTRDENIERWNAYENSPEVRKYISAFGTTQIEKEYNHFMAVMDKLTLPNKSTLASPSIVESYAKPTTAIQIAQELRNIDKINHYIMYGGEGYKNRLLYSWAIKDYVKTGHEDEEVALMYIDVFRISLDLPPRLSAKIKPGSITTNVVDSSRSNTQQIENHLTTANVVSVIKKEHGIIKDTGDSVEFIPNAHKDYKKFEAEVTYNPFDEEEELDSPVLL